MSEPREPSKAEAYLERVAVKPPSIEFVNTDGDRGQYRVRAQVGVALQDGVTPTLVIVGVRERAARDERVEEWTSTIALRNDNALALAAFILDTFKPRGDDLSLAS